MDVLREALVMFWLVLVFEFAIEVDKTAPVPSKGRGKAGPLKKLAKNPRFHKAFMQLGEEWNLKYHVLKQMEELTCLMDGLHAKLLRKIVSEDEKRTTKSNVDLARLPLHRSALKPYLQRVNHRVALYKHAYESIMDREEEDKEEEENEEGRV
ncbi:hypothetical protein NP493_551g03033 [Ridgeia piscesae]|uniref:Uncharacterized protein n=1 Tax=Ridgeia piscesae TaxID=27915 RepID=A0AAD9NQ42_RIDPI|nr:hypothetical protein NP493_551g03033 [Ridgeia piscesae]